jgi:hypothetical protein
MYKMSQWRSGKAELKRRCGAAFANGADKSLGAVFKLTKEPENLHG